MVLALPVHLFFFNPFSMPVVVARPAVVKLFRGFMGGLITLTVRSATCLPNLYHFGLGRMVIYGLHLPVILKENLDSEM